ncbi:hypothetical protein E2K80_12670 [Rhodophyticola sp. CCM32]|uniref:hypothetical protein n=1 Tax=Rhodophyticola sp. CCM32 TaxID=2916397 RepID=UPI00107FBA0F|nr:hypothetical protein [Rhodophyticola sp. CCM32]QBY01470.1 hypothetical protein E2K80_12670 [Rhodophyticola sp. CCM32]
MTANTTNPGLKVPALTLQTVALILISGAVGTLAFDLWGKAISPLLGFAQLAPVGLARGFLGAIGLPNNAAAGNLMHLFFVGVIAYPVGWLFIARPVIGRVIPQMPWLIASAIYGAGLWVFAIGGITMIAGLPFFLGFTGITWVALAGHVFYAIAAAAAVAYIERLQNR